MEIYERDYSVDHKISVGHGYDVHRLVVGRPLVLGGVKIEYEMGLDGHSDADVLLHAVCDALLGAASLGDIGKHFPDNDDSFKNIDSMILLERTVALIHREGYRVVNIDCTLIAQKPKISPYIGKMRENISRVCQMNIIDVNVKATTEEKLGFTGAGEGMSAHAVCLVER